MNVFSLWALTFILGIALGLFLRSKSWTLPKLIFMILVFLHDINVLLEVSAQCPK